MRRKTEKVVRFCVICGDKAKGFNFNALTCQSCKAFFRRNALSNKEFKCSFSDSCDIDKNTRKFCPACRLKKCFENGMKKEWILSEEEKRSIREKITLNRLRRGKLQQFCNDEILLTSSSSIDYQKNRSDSISTISDANNNNQISDFKLLSSPSSSSFNNTHFVDSVQHHFFPYKRLTSTIITGGVQTTNLDGFFNHQNNQFFQENNSINNLDLNKKNQQLDNIQLSSIQQSGTTLDKSSSSVDDDDHQHHNNQERINENKKKFQLPNLPINAQPIDSINNMDVDKSSAFEQFNQTENEENISSFIRTDSSSATFSKNKDPKNYLRNYLENFDFDHFGFESFPSIFNIDPIMEFSTKLEQNVFSTFDGSYFSILDKCTLKELCVACTMLHNPYKRISFIRTSNNIHSHLCTIVDSYLHRMICMSKHLSSFNQLSLDDQFRLLKYGLIEMFCLRTVLTFDANLQTWEFMDDHCKLSMLVYMDAVKPCCIGYDYRTSVINFYNSFKYEWKSDNIIIDLLTAIVLFTERTGINDRDKIREEQFRLSELLKHYLEMKYPNIVEAHHSYDRLLLIVKAMQLLHQDLLHIIASTAGYSSSSPLLIQLTDHYHKQSVADGQKCNCNIDLLSSSGINPQSRCSSGSDVSSTTIVQEPNTNANGIDNSQNSISSFITDECFN